MRDEISTRQVRRNGSRRSAEHPGTASILVFAGLIFAGCARSVDTAVAKESATPAASASAETPSAAKSDELQKAPQTPVSHEQHQTGNNPQWGDLVGRFAFEGALPKPQSFSIEKDVEFCSKHSPADESLIVHPGNRGIANIVVRLETKSADKSLPVHESYRESASARVPLDNHGCRFLPHVCLLRTTQTLVISNRDEVAHNTAAYLNRNDPFNEVTAAGQRTERHIELIERLPVKVNCSIHPWMSGWLVVSDHPYAAVTDDSGRFRIRNLPVGERTFQIWQEKAGLIARGTRDGQRVEWKRGRVTLKLEPGENDLREIHVPADAFMPEE